MIAAFVMIMLGVLILWISAEYQRIIALIWIKVGYHLFETVAIHTDDDTGACHGLTFTNDELWQEKMLKDLKAAVEKNNRLEES